MELKKGMVVITQGDPSSIVSRLIRWATGSWWTHGFVVISDTEGMEAKFPRVCRLSLKERFAELEAGGRDYAVMDLPNITDEQREQVVLAALKLEGRLYDIWNCLYYGIFKMWVEGSHRFVCSRLMSAVFYDSLDVKIFDGAIDRMPSSLWYRLPNLSDGYCTPDEVLRYSILTELMRTNRLIKH